MTLLFLCLCWGQTTAADPPAQVAALAEKLSKENGGNAGLLVDRRISVVNLRQGSAYCRDTGDCDFTASLEAHLDHPMIRRDQGDDLVASRLLIELRLSMADGSDSDRQVLLCWDPDASRAGDEPLMVRRCSSYPVETPPFRSTLRFSLLLIEECSGSCGERLSGGRMLVSDDELVVHEGVLEYGSFRNFMQTLLAKLAGGTGRPEFLGSSCHPAFLVAPGYHQRRGRADQERMIPQWFEGFLLELPRGPACSQGRRVAPPVPQATATDSNSTRTLAPRDATTGGEDDLLLEIVLPPRYLAAMQRIGKEVRLEFDGRRVDPREDGGYVVSIERDGLEEDELGEAALEISGFEEIPLASLAGDEDWKEWLEKVVDRQRLEIREAHLKFEVDPEAAIEISKRGPREEPPTLVEPRGRNSPAQNTLDFSFVDVELTLRDLNKAAWCSAPRRIGVGEVGKTPELELACGKHHTILWPSWWPDLTNLDRLTKTSCRSAADGPSNLLYCWPRPGHDKDKGVVELAWPPALRGERLPFSELEKTHELTAPPSLLWPIAEDDSWLASGVEYHDSGCPATPRYLPVSLEARAGHTVYGPVFLAPGDRLGRPLDRLFPQITEQKAFPDQFSLLFKQATVPALPTSPLELAVTWTLDLDEKIYLSSRKDKVDDVPWTLGSPEVAFDPSVELQIFPNMETCRRTPMKSAPKEAALGVFGFEQYVFEGPESPTTPIPPTAAARLFSRTTNGPYSLCTPAELAPGCQALTFHFEPLPCDGPSDLIILSQDIRLGGALGSDLQQEIIAQLAKMVRNQEFQPFHLWTLESGNVAQKIVDCRQLMSHAGSSSGQGPSELETRLRSSLAFSSERIQPVLALNRFGGNYQKPTEQLRRVLLVTAGPSDLASFPSTELGTPLDWNVNGVPLFVFTLDDCDGWRSRARSARCEGLENTENNNVKTLLRDFFDNVNRSQP